MNVMRWRKIDHEWIRQIEDTKVNFSKENFLAGMGGPCQKVSYADIVFYFTPDVSHYVGQSIFLIESYASNFILYKGQFSHQIVIKGVLYCIAEREYRPSS